MLSAGHDLGKVINKKKDSLKASVLKTKMKIQEYTN